MLFSGGAHNSTESVGNIALRSGDQSLKIICPGFCNANEMVRECRACFRLATRVTRVLTCMIFWCVLYCMYCSWNFSIFRCWRVVMNDLYNSM